MMRPPNFTVLVTGIVVLTLGVLLVLLSACSGPRDEGGPDPGLRGEWELQSATDAGGNIPLANQLIRYAR